MSIAQTIADQIGRRAFFMMGAKHLTDSGQTLRFRVGRNSERVNIVTVTLDASDTYSLRFSYLRGIKDTERSSVEGIYADQLHIALESGTGMRMSL